MTQLRPLLALLTALLLSGCAGAPPTTAPSSPPPTADTAASEPSPPQPPSDPTPAEPARPDDTASAPVPTTAPQDWFHLDRVPQSGPGLDTRAAYNDLLAGRSPRDTVRVAILDSGIDIDHEDLAGAAWTNADEVPNNGVDDDNNGYVDDLHGWNFIGGPDGENVNQDTYELTRLYVDLRDRFGTMDSSAVPPPARAAYRRYQRLKRTFQKKRQQAQQRLQQVQRAETAVNNSRGLLRQHLEVDTLTQAAVQTIAAGSPEVRRAKKTLQFFYQQGLTPADLRAFKEQLQRQVEYNYNPDFNPRPVVGDDYPDKTERYYGNSDVTGPDASHGTHVAGIVGASRANEIGIDGIARGVRLMSVRTVPNGDERDKDVANAIRYAVENGADVINMSFGKKYSPHKEVVDAAVQYADSMGVLMVHAAGNDGANVDSTDNFPSPYYHDGGRAQRWIEVGASSWKGGKQLAARFTNYGAERVDVFAPGQSIYSTVPDDQYDRNDGTSMAAPMVSGLAALLMAYYPTLSALEVREIILSSATRQPTQPVSRPGNGTTVAFGELSRTGAVVNAPAALRRAAERAGRTE